MCISKFILNDELKNAKMLDVWSSLLALAVGDQNPELKSKSLSQSSPTPSLCSKFMIFLKTVHFSLLPFSLNYLDSQFQLIYDF